MSITTWTQFIAEFQQSLAAFDLPTRLFIYALAIGLTILSLSFAYYMTKLSFEFTIKIMTEIFDFLKRIFALPIEGLKSVLKDDSLIVEEVEA